MFPPIPTWDGLHPVVVHFPIALLLIAPLFVLASLYKSKLSFGFAISALALMVLGTFFAWLSVSTGEAAEAFAPRSPGVEELLHRHHDLAEITLKLFFILTLLYAALLFVPLKLKKELSPKMTLAISIVFLLLYASSSLILINTAHLGGSLVHEYGVHARMSVESTP